jgi:hypothetical protein
LVSETTGLEDLATQAGKPSGLGRAVWFGAAAVACVALLAWRMLGAEPDIANAGPSSTSTSTSTSLAPVTAEPTHAATPMASGTTEQPGAAVAAPSAHEPHQVTARGGAGGSGAAGAETSPEPSTAHVTGRSEPSSEPGMSNAERRALRRKRQQEQQEQDDQAAAEDPASRESAPANPKAGAKHKARAPAHMQRDDF